MTGRDEEFAEFARARGPALVRTAYLLTGGSQRARGGWQLVGTDECA